MIKPEPIDKEVFKNVLDGLAGFANSWLAEFPEYAELEEEIKENGLGAFLFLLEHKMSIQTLIASDIIKKHYAIDPNVNTDELYFALMNHQADFRGMTKQIEEAEGRICSVDKAYGRTAKHYREIIQRLGGDAELKS